MQKLIAPCVVAFLLFAFLLYGSPLVAYFTSPEILTPGPIVEFPAEP